MLQVKRISIMPAPDQNWGQAPAGIQVIRRRGGSRPALAWISTFAGKTDGAVDFLRFRGAAKGAADGSG